MTTDFPKTKLTGHKVSNLYKLATTLRLSSQKLSNTISTILPKLWLHLGKDGSISLKETNEKMSQTKFVVRPPNIEILRISITENLLYLVKPVIITIEERIWNQDYIDISNLEIYKAYISNQINIAESHFTWPKGEILNTGRSKSEIWSYLTSQEKSQTNEKKPLRHSTTF